MKIVITGASGFVGQSLVPLLDAAGADLLLVGRNPQQMASAYPQNICCSYDDLAAVAEGYDLLLHLAVVNNNADVSSKDFYSINVDFMNEILNRSKQAGIKKFIYFSSVHALDLNNQSLYAESKREAAKQLKQAKGINAQTIYLPLVYGETWGGKLTFLNPLPRKLAKLLFYPLTALKPTVHVEKLVNFILNEKIGKFPDEIILADDQSKNPIFVSAKRLVDLLFATSVVVLFWWGLILIWALIRLQSKGPGIFAQNRIGQEGVEFTCYKYRTMKLGTQQAATHEVSTSSVTPLGFFLRKIKLDELPQVWNIFRNEISLIGPRPCLPTQKQLIELRRAHGVLCIKPGITGLAQINDIDMSNPELLTRWDARYLALRSLFLDFRIVISTATGRGQGDKVQK